MSRQVDLKVRLVSVGQYLYRHEAEFAAGFLADAGIPYRLQFDDAGGADLGLSLLRPARLWVRAVDLADARDALALDDEDPASPVFTPTPLAQEPPTERVPSLTPLERAMSAGLGVAMFSAVPYVPSGPFRPTLGGLCLAAGLAFLIATAIGRAPGPLERIIKTFAGSVPQ